VASRVNQRSPMQDVMGEARRDSSRCPDVAEITGFAERLLPAARREVVEAHIAECLECRTLVFALVDTSDASERLPSASRARVGRFLVHEVIGAGAMGTVYRAHDPELDRPVAVKVHAGTALEVDGGERLRREAQALARLNHPNVVAVYEAGLHGDVPFVAMELVDGVTLDEWMREPRTFDEIVTVFASIGRGLAAAHDAGLVHRDVKPRNVFIASSGAVKLGDFGLVRADALVDFGGDRGAVDDTCDVTWVVRSELTVTLSIDGAIIGTPAYMAPEQLRGALATAGSDQFSFCVMLYEAVYGVRPFGSASPSELVAAMQAPLEVPSLAHPSIARRVPRHVRDVLVRGLAIEPAHRFSSMEALLATLAPAPHGRGWGIAAAVALVSVAASAFAFAAPATGDVCSIEDEDAERVFSRARLSRIAESLGTERVTEILEGYAATWRAARTTVCRATTTGQQSSQLGDRQRACLEARLQRADELLGLLATTATPTMSRALDAALALEPVEACTRATVAHVPPPMTQAGTVAHLQRELAKIDSSRRLGDIRGTSRIGSVVAAARAVGYPALLARALLTEADVLAAGSGEIARREALMEEAAREAAKAGDDELVATIYADMVYLVGIDGSHVDAALQWARVADVALVRAKTPREADWNLRLNRAAVLGRQGNVDEAIRLLEAAIASRAGEKVSLPVAHAVNNLGGFLADQGSDRAASTLRTAIDMYREVYGTEQHRNVIASVLNLGMLSLNNGDPRTARAYLERALVVAETVLAPDHVYVATALDALGECEAKLGNPREAIVLHSRAIAILTSKLGRENPRTAGAIANFAESLALVGEFTRAKALFVDAIALLEAAHGTSHEAVAFTRIGYGLVLARSHEPRAARQELEAGLAVIDRHGPSRVDVVTDARAQLLKLGPAEKSTARPRDR
jgi:tetratricopeptide (TPR) repeat protein